MMNHSQEANDRALVQLHSGGSEANPDRRVNPAANVESSPPRSEPAALQQVHQPTDRSPVRTVDRAQQDYLHADFRRRPRDNDSGTWFYLCMFLILAIAGGGVYLFVFGENQFALQVTDNRDSQPVISNRLELPTVQSAKIMPAGDVNGTNVPQPNATSAEPTRAVVPTTVDSAIALMLQADDTFSRLKTGLVDLQRDEQQRSQNQRRTFALTKAIATGYMEIHAGPEPTRSGVMPLVYVPPGQFLMGQTEPQRRESARASSSSHYDFSVPAHGVKIRSGYFIGLYEVPASQLREFRESTQPKGAATLPTITTIEIDGEKPACDVDWQTAVDYCHWLSKINGLTVRLPTEIEWEYAARGSQYIQQFESLKDSSVVMGGPWPVNAENLDRSWCGCYAMNSNVQEWCIDAWDENAYRNRERIIASGRTPTFNYSGLDSASLDARSDLRSVRGCNFRDSSANRDPSLRRYKPASASEPTVGFRVVVPIPTELFQGDLP
jgi:formylglycine-generating enzyme required for sulfatase activity